MNFCKNLFKNLPFFKNRIFYNIREGFFNGYNRDVARRHGVTLGQIRYRFEFMRRMLNTVDLLIAPSKFLMRKFIAFGIAPKKIIYSDYSSTYGLGEI